MEEEEDELDDDIYGEEELELEANELLQRIRQGVDLAAQPRRADQRHQDIINAPNEANQANNIRDLEWDIGR